MDSKETYFDKLLRKIKNYKFISIILIIGVSIGAVAQFTDSLNSIINIFYEKEPPVVIWDIELPAYVITDSAFPTKRQAGERLVELSNLARNDKYFEEHFNKFGFFWIPDFKYLTNKELYQVYIGPYKNEEDAQKVLCDYKERYNKQSYGILLSDKPGRYDFNCTE